MHFHEIIVLIQGNFKQAYASCLLDYTNSAQNSDARQAVIFKFKVEANEIVITAQKHSAQYLTETEQSSIVSNVQDVQDLMQAMLEQALIIKT